MSWEIREVRNNRDLKIFVQFPLLLYQGHPFYVPLLLREEMGIFIPSKNPAYQNCESKLFLVYRHNRCVGRIAGIISHVSNQKYQEKNLRFGWLDMINDEKSTELLFSAVETWGKKRGMTSCTGPMGFTDFDPAGILIQGFEELGTMATRYNYPYYGQLVEKCGYRKLIDSLEFQTMVPHEKSIPQNLIKSVEWVKKRYKYQVLKFPNKKEALKRGMELINLIDESYTALRIWYPMNQLVHQQV